MTSVLDRKATDEKKQTIIAERENKKYEELVDKFLKDTKIDVDNKEWKKISFSKQRVTLKTVEQQESTEQK